MTKVLTAFNDFKSAFLVGKKSIFTGEADVLNLESIKFLKDNFINQGMAGSDKFVEKLDAQLKNGDPNIRQQAVEVMAHAVWLWRLVPHNASHEGRSKVVN